ncbi:hypothetical protein ACFYST_19485 [Kitasatospora sp. NPDC004614]|uniref:hypothetical protein n=1 Tax=unclassified Kitasatospora TaxID=2633591 RepID=UPI0036B27998
MVTAHVDQQLAQLRTALPWATPLGTTVADICETYPANTGFTRRTWTPVMCTRTGTAYLAFDGDFREHLAQLDTTLATAGWKPKQGPGDPPGLVADFDRMHPVDGPPDKATMQYTPPIPSVFVIPHDNGAYPLGPHATVEVVQAPLLPRIDDGTAEHDRTLEYPTVTPTHFVDWQPYSHTQLSTAYPAHGAILAISVRLPYNT